MPHDEDPAEPEIVQETKEDRAIRSLEEVRALLRRNNALMERVCPLLEKAEQAGLLDGNPAGQPRTMKDYMGQGLLRGKFDGLLGTLQKAIEGGLDPKLPNPRRRRR